MGFLAWISITRCIIHGNFSISRYFTLPRYSTGMINVNKRFPPLVELREWERERETDRNIKRGRGHNTTPMLNFCARLHVAHNLVKISSFLTGNAKINIGILKFLFHEWIKIQIVKNCDGTDTPTIEIKSDRIAFKTGVCEWRKLEVIISVEIMDTTLQLVRL